MFGLKIFVRVQTFWWVPPVLPCNFCHPAQIYSLFGAPLQALVLNQNLLYEVWVLHYKMYIQCTKKWRNSFFLNWAKRNKSILNIDYVYFLFWPKKALFLPKDLQKVRKSRQIFIRDKIASPHLLIMLMLLFMWCDCVSFEQLFW